MRSGEAYRFDRRSRRLFRAGARVPVEYHRALIKAEALRRRGDYGPFADVTAADAEGQVSQAERFLEFAVKLICSGVRLSLWGLSMPLDLHGSHGSHPGLPGQRNRFFLATLWPIMVKA